MKRYITATGMVTVLIFCFTMGDAFAGKKILDNFSGTYMDAKKWQYREYVREIANGKLVLKLGNNLGSNRTRNEIGFMNPELIKKIACTVMVVDVKPDTGTDPASFARVAGFFYNVEAAGGGKGNIHAEIDIGDRGNGLEAFYEVLKALDDNYNNWEIIGSGTLIPPGTLQTGIAYPVELEYTNAHDIIFRVAGQSIIFPDAGRQRPPTDFYKELASGIDVTGSSGTGYVSALFDDVFINDQVQAYDRFSSALIDTTKWTRQEEVREISNGKLRMGGRICNPAGNTGIQRVSPNSSPVNFTRNYIEAKMLIESGTQIPPGQYGFARFAGWYYNDSRGPGSGQDYDENDGDVWVSIRLRINPGNGQLEAVAAAWRSDADPDWSPGQDLLWEVFPTVINYDTEYTFSIEFTGSRIIFRCNNLAPVIYQVQTPIYEPSEKWTAFHSRVWANPGQCSYIKATFDDVYVFSPDPLTGSPGAEALPGALFPILGD